ncbi:MAG: hypothetical protein IPM06_19875 [Rhizobiales bacterium]|nr:hypothetical protein [Hyphomicrobiales bacterium]
MAFDFYIDIMDRALTRYGSGPITTATFWQSNHPVDKAGSFSFEMSAIDAQVDEVLPLRIVRAYAWIDGDWTEVASGVIESIQRVVSSDGTVMLRVSGMDMLKEYSGAIDRSTWMGAGTITGGVTSISHDVAVIALEDIYPSLDIASWYEWSNTPDPGNTAQILFATGGQTCLSTVLRVAALSQCHVYISGFRALTFASTFTDSGIAAVQAGGELGIGVCAITDLQIESNTAEYASRIYAVGGGNGEAELKMTYATRTAPTGYTFSAANGYIENDALQATFPVSARVGFKDVIPVTNTSGDIEAADNVLFDSALRWLQQHAGAYAAPVYSVAVAQCGVALRPMQTIRLMYRNLEAGIEIDENLNILEATLRIDANGLRTTNLVISAGEYWPQSSDEIVASNLQQGQIYSSAAQPDVNNYAVSVRGALDTTNTCTFSIRLGSEILQVQSIFVDFQIAPFQDETATVTSDAQTGSYAGGTTGAGGTAATGQSGTVAGGLAGTGATGQSGTALGGAAGHGQVDRWGPVGQAQRAQGDRAGGASGTGATGQSGTASGGAPSVDATNAGGNTSAGPHPVRRTWAETSGTPTPGTTNVGGNAPGTPSTNISGTAGGTTSIYSAHSHDVTVYGITNPAGYPVYMFYNSGDSKWYFGAPALGGNATVATQPQGGHNHDMASHSHSLSDHTHSAGAGHTHSLSAHTHDAGAGHTAFPISAHARCRGGSHAFVVGAYSRHDGPHAHRARHSQH